MSPYAQKVKIALREKGITFETRLPPGVGGGRAAGDFARANPRLEVPALVDGAAEIFDSTIILEYIEEKWPTPPLLPADPAMRAEMRMIEEVMDTHFEAINWGLSEVRWFRRATGDLAATIEARAKEQAFGYLTWLERKLADREWFSGEDFGWGDLCVFPYINGVASFGHRPERESPLGRWVTRARERPSVRATRAEAAAAVADMVRVSANIERGEFRREYRDHRLEWMIKTGGLQVVLDGLKEDDIRFSPDLC
jgi:glutathione S-transferase/RNA polymerase-associated protein